MYVEWEVQVLLREALPHVRGVGSAGPAERGITTRTWSGKCRSC